MSKQKKNEYKLVGRIPYYISNQGDGSAAMRECASDEIAESYDENQSEGWGESSSSSVDIYEKDGKLYFKGITTPYNEDDEWEYDEDYVPLVE